MDFTIIDLIAATTNALSGALLARRPSHYRHYTVISIVLLVVLPVADRNVKRDLSI